MPTVLREGPYRVYFVTHDCREPAHVHIDTGDLSAKFWLQPISVVRNRGYPAIDLRKLTALINREQARLLGAWDEHCGRASFGKPRR